MNTRLIVFLVVVCLLAILLVQNQGVVTAPAPYRIFFWRVDIAPVALIPILVVAGFIAGLVAGWAGRRTRRPAPPAMPGTKESAQTPSQKPGGTAGTAP